MKITLSDNEVKILTSALWDKRAQLRQALSTESHPLTREGILQHLTEVGDLLHRVVGKQKREEG